VAWRGLWYVVKVERLRGPGVQPFEEVKDRVRTMLLVEKLRRRQAEVARDLRRRARVEVLVR
jgi:parvulin-like peptidyl-prolyl isomerase